MGARPAAVSTRGRRHDAGRSPKSKGSRRSQTAGAAVEAEPAEPTPGNGEGGGGSRGGGAIRRRQTTDARVRPLMRTRRRRTATLRTRADRRGESGRGAGGERARTARRRHRGPPARYGRSARQALTPARGRGAESDERLITIGDTGRRSFSHIRRPFWRAVLPISKMIDRSQQHGDQRGMLRDSPPAVAFVFSPPYSYSAGASPGKSSG